MPATDLKIGTFVLIPNFNTQKRNLEIITTTSKRTYHIIDKPTEVTYKLTDPSKKEIVHYRNNLLPYYPKEHALRELTQLFSFTGSHIVQNNPHVNSNKNQKTIQQKNANPQKSNTPE